MSPKKRKAKKLKTRTDKSTIKNKHNELKEKHCFTVCYHIHYLYCHSIQFHLLQKDND